MPNLPHVSVTHSSIPACNLSSPSPLLGIDPTVLRGTDTGVWIGVSGSEAGEAFSADPEQLLGYSMTGCQRAMFANRISYFFDFKGKSADKSKGFQHLLCKLALGRADIWGPVLWAGIVGTGCCKVP